MNNIRTINEVKTGNTPKYWDMQQRCYMELLNASFSCIFLGWGNRPGLDTNAMHRIERDNVLGASFLEKAESFMTDNVEAGNIPSFRNIRNYERMNEAIESLYGSVVKNEQPIKFDKKVKPALNAIIEAEEAIAKIKVKKSEIESELKKAQEEFENLQMPIIEELKNNAHGLFIDDDGTHFSVTYDVKNALNVQKVHDLYPDVYDQVCKPAIDTSLLKKMRPDVYSDCFEPKIGSKRNFVIRTWKEK